MRAVVAIDGPLETVRQMLALTAALQRRGHALVVVLSPEYEAAASRLGMPTISGPAIKQITLSADSQDAEFPLEARTAVVLEIYRRLVDLCREADVLIATPSQL